MKRSWSPAETVGSPAPHATDGGPLATRCASRATGGAPHAHRSGRGIIGGPRGLRARPIGWPLNASSPLSARNWRPYDVARLAVVTSAGGPEAGAEAVDPVSALAAEDEAHPERPRMRAEAVLLVSKTPLSPRKLAQLAHLADATEARTLVRQLNQTYEECGRAIRVEQIAGGYRMMTRPALAPWLARLGHLPQMVRLSTPMMETLAVVAYRQPVSRANAEAVRGVACGELLRQLMERDLIRIVGRSEELGRPYLYGTTKRFLQLFGLPRLDALPPIDWHAMQQDQTNDDFTSEDSPADSLTSTKEPVVSTAIAPTSTEDLVDSDAWTVDPLSDLTGVAASSLAPAEAPSAVDDDDEWEEDDDSEEDEDEDWDDEDDWDDDDEEDLDEEDEEDDDLDDELDSDEDDLEDDDWEEVDDELEDDELDDDEDDWDDEEDDDSAEDDEDWE